MLKKSGIILFFIPMFLCLAPFWILFVPNGMWLCPPSFCARPSQFEVLDFTSPNYPFFDQESFISGKWSRPSTSDGAFERGTNGVRWNEFSSRASVSIWRFRFLSRAHSLFEFEVPRLPSGDIDILGTDELPNALRAASGCGATRHVQYQCGIVAQYDEYVLVLYSSVDEPFSIEELEKWILSIDSEFAEKTGNPIQTILLFMGLGVGLYILLRRQRLSQLLGEDKRME